MNADQTHTRQWYTGSDVGLKLCLSCHRVCPLQRARCPRCGAVVHQRRQNSIARSWALTITAALLYIPANLLPMMTVSRFEEGQPQTIISGVIELVQQGMIPIAVLVFTASVLVPIVKLLVMVWLLICVRFPGTAIFTSKAMHRQLMLYRMIIWIGRWSMLDIFIISLLAGLVKFGQLGTVTAGAGAYAFAGVVVTTMLAAIQFDPRLLWDAPEPGTETVTSKPLETS